MLFFVVLGVTLKLTNSEKFFQIEDIPIENFSFEQDDLQNDAMDIELMPRRSRSFPPSNEDPKQYFFSSSLYGENSYNVRDIPKPGGFSSYSDESEDNVRHKREATESPTLKRDEREAKSIVKKLGKPLELVVMDPENVTEKSEDISTELPVLDEISETSNFLINDFIRFKRGTTVERMAEDVSRIKDLMKKIDDENKSKANEPSEDPKSEVEDIPLPHTEKIVMDSRDLNTDPLREAPGTIKEQWVKQPYPVRRGDELDDSPSASEERDHVRAPRVHFVTQRMSESAPRPEYNRYDRDARARNLNKELSWKLGRDPYREMDYYQPRYTRNYVPSSYPGNYRNDRYFAYDSREPYDNFSSRSRYYDYPERTYDNYNNNYSASKGRQRRIIYYASLPEITRIPESDSRDRYEYRGRYDDRHFYPDQSYQLKKPYTKLSYDENEDRQPQRPLKVSTDVSVREVKKNPERRIYSEVERNRYPQSSPYQNERI